MKNSLATNSQKLLRVRKLYKRFSPVFETFSITRFSTFFRKTDFFNSHNLLPTLIWRFPEFLISVSMGHRLIACAGGLMTVELMNPPAKSATNYADDHRRSHYLPLGDAVIFRPSRLRALPR